MKSVRLMIDVPQGDMIGFPKEFPQNYPGSTIGWLAKQGYPLQRISDQKAIRFFWEPLKKRNVVPGIRGSIVR